MVVLGCEGGSSAYMMSSILVNWEKMRTLCPPAKRPPRRRSRRSIFPDDSRRRLSSTSHSISGSKRKGWSAALRSCMHAFWSVLSVRWEGQFELQMQTCSRSVHVVDPGGFGGVGSALVLGPAPHKKKKQNSLAMRFACASPTSTAVPGSIVSSPASTAAKYDSSSYSE